MRLDWSIWVLNSVLQWVLLALVLRRDRWRKHKAFALYIGFCSCKTTSLMWIALHRPQVYASINWSARLIGLFLMVAVLLEVFAAVFRPYSTLPDGTLRWFKIALCGLVLATAAAAVYFPGSAPGHGMNTLYLLNRSATMIFCGAFGFAALVSSYFGIPWQTRTYGIGVGFLLFMSVDLFTASLSAGYGEMAATALRNVAMLSYTLALASWLTYFASADKLSETPTLEQMQRLQKALDSAGRVVESSRSIQ